MKSKTLVSSLEETYTKRFARIRTQTFRKMVSDRNIAIKYAKIGLAKTGTNNPSIETVNTHADIMQSVAKLIIDQRTKRGKSNRLNN